MDNLLISSVLGTSAGIIGTGMGGAIALILNRSGKRFISVLLGFSSGLMLTVVCFDLLPTSFEIGNLMYGILGIIMGVAVMFAAEDLTSASDFKMRYNLRQHYAKVGILLGIGIALHNFPEGLAIGSGFTAIRSYGIGMSLVIAIHNIPEGMAMAVPMSVGEMNKAKIMTMVLLAGVPTGIGAFVGCWLGEVSPVFISVCLAFAGGAMLYITCGELIPESRILYRGRISTLGVIAGVIVGILISATL